MSQPWVRGRTLAAGSSAEPGPDDEGSLILMLAVMFVAILALAGLVIDGGAKLVAAENATAIAQEAARAGAGMVNRSNAYEHGSFVVDDSQAREAAQEYLATAGYSGVVSLQGVDTIKVSVTVSEPTKVLSLIGIDTINATGEATARLVAGVTGGGQ
jgi:hypothetical protein